MADPPTYGPGDIDEAFRHWHSTRAKLAHALLDYLSVSTTLCTVLSSPARHPASRRALEQALVGIDLELATLQSSEGQLARTRTNLSNARNSSQALITINKLPLETLAMVFTASSRRCLRSTSEVKGRTIPPTVLAGVCGLWRQLALRTPSLWSHIDIVMIPEWEQRDSDRAKLWAERSRDTPIDLDIWEYEGNARNTSSKYFSDTPRMTELLAPLMPRVSDVRTFVKSQSLLDCIIKSWIRNGTLATKKSLRVLGPSVRDALLLPPEDCSGEEFNSLFRSFHTFAIRRCEIFPGVLFHEGLVELYIESLDDESACPTPAQFAAALMATPRLRTLILVYVEFDSWGGIQEDNLAPATLNYLEYLTLESGRYRHVLPLLSIGSESLNMSLTLSTDPEYIAAVELFFRRTKVTTLHASAAPHLEKSLCLPSILCPIPHLQTLSIAHCNLSEENLRSLYVPDSNNFKHIPWPRLCTLSITDSDIDEACLRTLAQLNSIQEINLYDVGIAGSQRPMTDEQCGVLRESLDTVGELEIFEDDSESPSLKWNFVELGQRYSTPWFHKSW